MIVLDTNVLSELMRAAPNEVVLAWVNEQPRNSLYGTRFSQAEILSGVANLPEGRRQSSLAATARAVFAEDFGSRFLPFNESAAEHYAEIIAKRRRAGRPIASFDALIAATALAAGAGVATRDVGGFEGCGLRMLVNPWTA
jgi:predicted nucleic acid-binding protein